MVTGQWSWRPTVVLACRLRRGILPTMTGGDERAATSGGSGHESPDASELLSEPDVAISEAVPLGNGDWT